jgi:4'-phosphopantetheinyl transferase
MAIEQAWRLPPPDLALPANKIHVWCAKLEQTPASIRQSFQGLSQDERERAQHFHFERDRRRFIVSHGALRVILGRYLRIEPDHVSFDYAPHGKPYLAQALNPCGIQFNMAHSNELAVYIFARGREAGIDVEYVHPIPELDQIAARFFSASENLVLRAIPAGQRVEAFFNCWTRKEAYIKALGVGLAQPLDQFQVSLIPGEPARLLKVEGLPEQIARYSMEAFVPAPGYIAALMVEGPECRPDYWQYPL